MEHPFHRFSELFAQLGLDSDPDSVRDFIFSHAPLPEQVRLEEAAFWTPSQASLLREALLRDADWAPVVDQLNVALRQAPGP